MTSQPLDSQQIEILGRNVVKGAIVEALSADTNGV